MQHAVALLALTASLVLPVRAQQAPELSCPDDRLDEVRRHQPVPGLFTAIAPPLAILNALARDPLAKIPTRAVSFRVIDEAGRPVPNALIGVIHRGDKSKRFLAEGAGGGAPVKLPHGRYTVNAAVVAKDRSVRFGTMEATVGANGPASVTVKLAGQAAPAVTKPAPERTVAGGSVPLELSGALRDRTVLAVVRHGVNVRARPAVDDEVILSQTGIEDGDPPEVPIPSKPGKYDIVAMLCAPRVPLARWTVTALPARIAIEAPDRAPMGSLLRTTLTGTLDRGHSISIGPTRGFALLGGRLAGGERETFELKLPYEPGTFEIRVTSHDRQVLASRTVNIELAAIPIEGPGTIKLGESASFSWPDRQSGKLKLEVWTLPGNGTPARRVNEVRDTRAIAGPGDYELRLVPYRGTDETVFGRKPFRIEGQAFVEAPKEAVAGSLVDATLSVDTDFFDKLYFFERGSSTKYHVSLNKRGPRWISVTAPTTPGSYDLVYLIGAVTGTVEAGRVPMEVRAR